MGLTFLLLTLGLAPAAVTVDAGTAVVIGEQPEVSASLFGLTAFEGFTAVVADPDYRARVAAIRPGCIRLAANVRWYLPEGHPGGLASPAARTAFNETLLFGSRYPTGRFLPVVRQLGAEPMASLGGVPAALAAPGAEAPADFARWAELCEQMLALWKERDPQLRLVQLWNEPNASWFRDPRAVGQGAAELHIAMAREVAGRLKRRWPELQIGGPVLCWPPAWPASQAGQKPWYTWEAWTVPWLRATSDLVDFFDFHVYDVTPDDLKVQIEMLANQAELSGRRLPIWITESNYNLADSELGDARAIWAKRVLPYERLLLHGVLPQADKLAGNLYHDLHARRHTLLPRGADDPDPVYWLLWVLRDLRGRRLAADSDDPAVTVQATLEEDRVTVVLFNDSPEPRDVPLSVSLPGGYWTGPEVRAIGPEQGELKRLRLEPSLARQPGRAVGELALPPYATASVSFRLTSFARPTRRRVIREVFGDTTFQTLAPGRPVAVNLPAGPAGRLRLGLLGPSGTERIAATLDGRPLSLIATAWQELGVPAAAGARILELRAEPHDNPRLALAFAAVVSEAVAED